MTIRHSGGATTRWQVALWLLGFLMPGCTKPPDVRDVCVDSDKHCGIACNYSHPCPTGLYCAAEQLCAKECTDSQGCSSQQHCSASGQCLAGALSKPSTAGAGAGDSSQAGSGGAGSSAYLLDAGAARDARVPAETCRQADVAATRVIPTVVLVIDQSGSMTQDFADSGSRWNVLREFLLKPDGLLAMFETQVRFGLAMYTALAGENDAGMPQCPMVTSVAPKLMNYSDISQAYNDAEPLGETPTGDAIDQIVDGLMPAQLDQTNGPSVLILATDGEPDRCEELNPQHGQAEAVAAVARAFSMGIRTYIISVGDEVSAQHQQDVANAGLGHAANDPAPYWKAGDDASLRAALTEIIAAQVSCEVALEGNIQNGDPCLGTVELNSQKLECRGKDGWELSDPGHIRLLGQACTDWKTLRNAMVHARFPCDVQVVF